MKKKLAKASLSLSTETLRNLVDANLADVAGGMMMNNTWTNCTHCECMTQLPGCRTGL